MKACSEELAALGIETGSDDLSNSSYEAASKLLLDSLGCAAAGHSQPGIREVVEQMCEWGGKPEASILFSDMKVPAPHAAFANSCMIHAFDYDDIYMPGILHISSVVVPAVLACAEIADASGKDTLAALTIGVEIAGRISTAERDRRRGVAFLPTSLAGSFGAVIAAARLFGLNREQTINAMGINYAQISGNRQALFDMTLTKRMQPGFAVRSALWAVALAQKGLTGPRQVFEGEAGYFKAYMNGDVPDIDELMFDCPHMQIERVSFKRIPSCGGCHHVQQAAERLAQEEKLSADDIDKVEIFGMKAGGFVSGPFDPGDHPQVDAQFNAAWGVAYALLRGTVKLKNYSDESIGADKEVTGLAQNITYIEMPDDLPDPVIPPDGFALQTSRYHGVVVHTKDGRRLIRAQSPAQTYDPDLFTEDMLKDKFKDCLDFSGLFNTKEIDEFSSSILNLGSAESCSTFYSFLHGENR